MEEDGLDVRPLSRPGNCEELSPPGLQGAMDDAGADPAVTRMVIVLPLEGNNAELRARIIKEVRKPGRNFEAIIRLLEEVKGPLDVQRYIIHHAIKEAARFKKRVLIQQLELALEEMEEKQLLSAGLNSIHSR